MRNSNATAAASAIFAAMFCALSCCSTVRAQDSATDTIRVLGANEGITVHGHGEIKAKPDIALATLSVRTQNKAQTAAVADNASKSQDMLAVLKASGVAATDIQTESYTVQPRYDYTVSPAILTDYEVVNSFRVTIRSIAKAGLILDKAIQAGANQTEGVTFDLSDRRKVNGEALVAAVTNARSKADLMAGAAGVSLGRLKNLSDTADQMAVIQPRVFSMAKAADSAVTPVAPQTLIISADVTANYAITQ